MNKVQINLGIYFCFFSLYTMTLYQSESLKKREKMVAVLFMRVQSEELTV